MRHYICEKTETGTYFLTDVAEYSSWSLEQSLGLSFQEYDDALRKLEVLQGGALAAPDAFIISSEDVNVIQKLEKAFS